jgi:hypothetical protein
MTMRMLFLLSFLNLSIAAADLATDLKNALTFHATFDGTTDASVALGDKRLFVAPSYKEQAAATPGLSGGDVVLDPGGGRHGGALRFLRKNTLAVFYRADKNVSFDPHGWTGSVSLWLNLDPEKDLEPGFCDPIQITDKAYNDSAIWADFTKDDKPRHFRLGVFGVLKSWNPENLPTDRNSVFLNRLVVVKRTPFARGQWTHIAITYSGLGGGRGTARLYLNGQPQGTTDPISEPFEWDVTQGAIRLGVGYVGLMDEVSIFRRALTPKEIEQLSKGKL